MKILYDFEAATELQTPPLAARRALEVAGLRLSVDDWRALALPQRMSMAAAGAPEKVDVGQVLAIIAAAKRSPVRVDPVPQPDAERAPEPVRKALGESRPVDAVWANLRALDRWVLARLAASGRVDAVARAFDEIASPRRVTAKLPPKPATRPEARMVDVSDKPVTHRRAVATARVKLDPDTLEKIASGDIPKGDVFAVARVAGIVAAKRTPELIPLAHVLAVTSADVELQGDTAAGEVHIRAVVEAMDRTGAEMEALTAASVAALTVYDMTKAVARWPSITDVRLEEKSGGRSGTVSRVEGGTMSGTMQPEDPMPF